jgi:phage terminase Nu1 subunit (DNA packaging protein)
MRRRRSLDDLLGNDSPKRPNGRPVEDHRQQLVLAQAEGQRIKNAKLKGELLDADEVEARWTAALLDVRAAILAVPSRFGARHGLSAAILADLDADLRDALASLAGEEPGHAG